MLSHFGRKKSYAKYATTNTTPVTARMVNGFCVFTGVSDCNSIFGQNHKARPLPCQARTTRSTPASSRRRGRLFGAAGKRRQHRSSVQFHWLQNTFFHHGQHISGHDWRLFAQEQVQSERRRSALRHACHQALCKIDRKRPPSALLRNTESGFLQRVAIVFHLRDKARLFAQRPRYRIADRAIPGAHDIEYREESGRLQHPAYFPENASFVRDVHTHMKHVGTVEGVSFKRQLQSAALSKLRQAIQLCT